MQSGIQIVCQLKKKMDVDVSNIISLKFQLGESFFNPVRSKSKHFHELLISKDTVVSKCFVKLNNFDLDEKKFS